MECKNGRCKIPRYKIGCLDRENDPKDPRDYQITSILPEIVELPESFMELIPKLSSVDHQNWGSCWADAPVESVKEFQEGVELSTAFVYVEGKKLSGRYDIQGDYIKTALKIICDKGVCEEKYFKDIKGRNWEEYAHREPSKVAYENALKHKGKTYWSVPGTIDGFKRSIFTYKTPVVFAMDWFKSYNNTSKNGILPMPKNYVGGHCVSMVGWDEDGFWIKNSWGKGWGKDGYFQIPFDDWNKHRIYSCWILLDNDKKMIYKINKATGEQYLVDNSLMLAFNIADNIELKDLQDRGLTDMPSDITSSELNNYRIYPLIEQGRLRDLFGLK